MKIKYKTLPIMTMLLVILFTTTTKADNKKWVMRTHNEIERDLKLEKDFYEIKWGDTLSIISNVSNIDIKSLCEINNINDPNKIYEGNKLFFIKSQNIEATQTVKEVTQTAKIVHNVELKK